MDLDNELNIPTEAIISLPPSSIGYSKLVFDGHSLHEIVTIPTFANEVVHGHSVQISSDSSIRNNGSIQPRSLIIGRQASAADIRVDHKSVSRRHTAFYYLKSTDDIMLVIQDLGGKHGTTVDGARLEKNCAVKLPFHGKQNEYVIQFGNAPVKCRLVLREIKGDGQQPREESGNVQMSNAQPMPNESSVASDVNAINLNSETEQTGKEVVETEEQPDTRESREAQIAAMIASFDSAPVYKKFVPDAEESMNEVTNGAASQVNAAATQQQQQQQQANNKYNLPITASISLTPGSNSFSSSDGTNTPLQVNSSVSALCFEPSGSRLVAGHRDGTLRFYDFHGMKPTTSASSDGVYYTPFRIVDSDNDPLDSTGRHVLTCLGPSPSGAAWIVGSTSSQPKVIDREGSATLFNFVKGDNYVTDSSNTKGHTAPVTGVAFHPLIKDVCFTCSRDGSIRQWDVSGKGKMVFQKWLVCQKIIGKCKNEKGQRTQITSNIGLHPSGRKLVVGTSCGSIQIWNCFGAGLNTRPLGTIYSAHGDMKPVTYVTFSNDGNIIGSRSDQDDTVRVWDANIIESGSAVRKNRKGEDGTKHPPSLLLAVCKGLDAINEIPNCAFSPCGKVLVAGTSINPRDTSRSACGKLNFYKLPDEDNVGKSKEKKPSKKKEVTSYLEPIVSLDVAPNASVLGVAWHPKLNQIAFGTSNGA
jgi:pSer/pThr/pTyr-binding forkhead associated (FHA) protein